MKKLFSFTMTAACLLVVSISSVSGAALGAEGEKVRQENAGALMSRIDFGNSYILGQTIKSGAVYLMQRKKSEITSMLKSREDYRIEILEDFTLGEPNIVDVNKKGK